MDPQEKTDLLGWFFSFWKKAEPAPPPSPAPAPPIPIEIEENVPETIEEVLSADLLARMLRIKKKDGSPDAEFCEKWISPLRVAIHEAELDSIERFGAFIAQVGWESGFFRELVENLNYSADRILFVFSKRVSQGEVAKFAMNPRALGERVYSNRMGNGPEGSGDGFNFRGRGLIQLTGRRGYELCGKALGVDLVSNPDLLAQPLYAARSAAWFWKDNRLNTFADKGDFRGLTLRINGGLNGYEQRLDLYRNALKVLRSA